MKVLLGLAMIFVGGILSYWAFPKAVEGQDLYNWIWLPGMFLAAFGMILVLARMRLWMRS
jgi:hypothetical protein